MCMNSWTLDFGHCKQLWHGSTSYIALQCWSRFFGSLALLSTWVCLLQSRNEDLAIDWQKTRLLCSLSSSNFGVTTCHLWRCLPSPHPLSSEDSVCLAMTICVLCNCHKWLHGLCMGGMPQQCRWCRWTVWHNLILDEIPKFLQVWQPVAGLWGTTSEQPRLICPSPVLQKAFADGWPWSTRKSTEAPNSKGKIPSGSCCKWHLRANSSYPFISHDGNTLHFEGLTCRGDLGQLHCKVQKSFLLVEFFPDVFTVLSLGLCQESSSWTRRSGRECNCRLQSRSHSRCRWQVHRELNGSRSCWTETWKSWTWQPIAV